MAITRHKQIVHWSMLAAMLFLALLLSSPGARAQSSDASRRIQNVACFALYYDKDDTLLYGEHMITVTERTAKDVLPVSEGSCPPSRPNVCGIAENDFCSPGTCASHIPSSNVPASEFLSCEEEIPLCDVLAVGRDAVYAVYSNCAGEALFAEPLRKVHGRLVRLPMVLGEDHACPPDKPYPCCQGSSCTCSAFPCR